MDLTELLNAVDAAVWGPPMIILLLGCHIYTTIRTKVIQRKLPLALKLSVTKDDGAEGDVSNFGAMATSLASTLGTGSIVGVATAVLSGGPGAVLWMWLTGILGMATKYTEVFAAMKYRVKDWRGEMMGGAMHVWEQRYKRPDGTVPWWAKLAAIWFALLACITIFGIGSANQRYHQCRACQLWMGSCNCFCICLRYGIVSYLGWLAEGFWYLRKTSTHHGRGLHFGMYLHLIL